MRKPVANFSIGIVQSSLLDALHAGSTREVKRSLATIVVVMLSGDNSSSDVRF